MTSLATLLMVGGTAFLLIAAIGLIRLPDPLQRMHSATKAGTLGITLLLIGVSVSGVIAAGYTVLLTIAFLLLTLPVGSQLLGRATYVSGTRLEGLEDDPLREELPRGAEPADPVKAARIAARSAREKLADIDHGGKADADPKPE